MTVRPTRAVIYARYSSDLQNPLSVRDQIASCHQLARRHGWKVVGEYADEAMSGMDSHRPGFQRLREELKAGMFELIIAESLNRISRSIKDTAEFYSLADYHHVGLHTISEGAIDKMRVAFTAMMAETFIDNLRVKTRRGQRAKVEAGSSGGGRSYGYDVARDERGDPIAGQLVILPDEAEVIRRIFRDYAAGISPLKIAAALNAEGIPAPRGRGEGSGHWKQNTINGNRERGTGILNNELYIGRRIWNRLEYRKHPTTSKRVSHLRPRSEWVEKEVPELRILEQELWEAAKARQGSLRKTITKAEAAGREGLGARNAARRRLHLLSGLLHCGLCGGRLTVAGTGKYRRYYCANHKEKGAAVCAGMPGLSKSEAEDLVLSGLQTSLMSEAAIARFRKDYARHLAEQTKGNSERVKRRTAEIRQCETQRLHFKAAIGNGHINETILEGLTEAEARLAELRAEAEQDSGNVIAIPEDLGTLYRARVRDLATTLSGGDVVGRAAEELHKLIARVDVHWQEDERLHRLDLQGDLVALFSAADKTKAASWEAAGVSLRLVAGACSRRNLPELRCAV